MSASGGLPAEVQKQINISLGAIVISNNFSFLTLGVVLCYAWRYYRKFPKDPWAFKALVTACTIMCIADAVGTAFWVYDWGVLGYANPAVLGLTHWSFPVEAMLLGTCSTLVQCFYAWRIHLISVRKNWIVPGVIVCLSLLGYSIVCWMVSILATHKQVADLSLVSPTVYVWLVGSVGADVIITASMIFYLDLRFRMSNAAKGSHPGRNRFQEIIRRTVEANVLSLLGQTVSVGLFNRPQVGFYFVLTDMTLAKVYTFSLLVSLCGRHSDGRENLSGGIPSSRSGEQLALSDRQNRAAGTRNMLSDRRFPPNTQVSINVQHEILDDQQWNKSKTTDEFEEYQKVRLPQGLPNV
ncbi:Sda1 family protein [Mycena venus]|uniref:Sda1 family protein n=1 Tax=Mycena venus TaxID=2733690 RepID=A0A8H6Y9X8_9AGAR|nr:Sda1 family protein [Mycena venus]